MGAPHGQKDAGKTTASGLCPDYPLFKRLSGEGGAMNTRVQSAVVAAFR